MEPKVYEPWSLPPAETDYRSQWSAMQRTHEIDGQARSQEEFDVWVREKQRRQRLGRDDAPIGRSRQLSQRSRRSVDSEEEEEVYYPSSGYSGEWVFRLLNPANPTRARRRVERVYWLSWRSFAYGLFLSGLGVMLLVLGSLWTYYGEERIRGLGVLLAATLLCIPGFYSLFVLFMYVRGKKGYSYRQLPDD